MSDIKHSNIPFLGGLRGLAAIIVFVSHAAIVGFLPSHLGHGFGQVGVMLFFLLSGFLMAHIYMGKDFSRENFVSYIMARIGRVVPLYLLVVFLSVIIYNFIYSDFRYALDLNDWPEIVRALLFVTAPYELWTIPVEFQFYIVFYLFGLFSRAALDFLG